MLDVKLVTSKISLFSILILMIFSMGFIANTNIKQSEETLRAIQDSLILYKNLYTMVKGGEKQPDWIPGSLNQVTFSSYNPVEGQTDADPLITASGDSVDHWTLAVSRDMLKKHNPDFGQYVYGDTVYAVIPLIIKDTMNKRYEKSADILSFSYEVSRQFGRHEGHIIKPSR